MIELVPSRNPDGTVTFRAQAVTPWQRLRKLLKL
jgi:hypothetical protein